MDLLTWFWPKVSDRKNAQFAITEAFFAAAVVAALTAIFTAVEALKDTAEGLGPEGFVSAIVFAGVGFGIYRRSRIAAVSGLVLYLVGRAYAWVKVGPNFGAIPLLVTLALLNGVRGTFAYHKLPPRPEGLPSLAQSFGALERNPAEGEKIAGKGEDGKTAGD
jgi:hypothetical protein